MPEGEQVTARFCVAPIYNAPGSGLAPLLKRDGSSWLSCAPQRFEVGQVSPVVHKTEEELSSRVESVYHNDTNVTRELQVSCSSGVERVFHIESTAERPWTLDYSCDFPVCGELSEPGCVLPSDELCRTSVVLGPGESYTEAWDGMAFQPYAQPGRGECLLYQRAPLGVIRSDMCERPAPRPDQPDVGRFTCQTKLLDQSGVDLMIWTVLFGL